MPKSVRSEMISYSESFPWNLSNKEFLISIICALITSLCMFAFCRIYPPLFLSENLDKKELVFAPASLQPSKFQLESAKRFTLCLDCTRSRIGWQVGRKLGECSETGSLEATDIQYPTSCPMSMSSCPLLNFIAVKSYDQTIFPGPGILLEESPNSLQGHTLKNTFHSLARCPFILSDCFMNMYHTE